MIASSLSRKRKADFCPLNLFRAFASFFMMNDFFAFIISAFWTNGVAIDECAAMGANGLASNLEFEMSSS